jgi:fructosamine-3-kinase
VPVVYRVTEHELVLEDLSGTPDWETLGRTLARVHLTSAEEFGWPHDNVIGPLPQPNGGRRRWPDFFVERRIIPFLDALPTHLSRRLALACEGPLPDLVDHDTRPSLIHGDLWSGNVVDGRWLVDPAVSYSDREIELAFSSLFGDLPDTFHRAYADVWRLDDGWEERRPALQLYHLLVHCRIFGGDYVHMVAQRLQHYHW